ncbi:hypothetical protein K437DRAFT_59797 [Tilletiaria anomala UBC 951]|uniref:Uncharacterized protein n=1 Tax=Tilletiaria anomala (strain ATCC 24038 / CBS 436.72 / UBC 951) TaxID=1037660 RepID=A0A066WE54_TILAU|nr:uncharacterized protein K437DRAFT_59797 [Tilletiaria anomala UBC 951]KDN50813.1 hypothetical protein K437DRAFT_59797 [Tilletiaria anomala UBC 951]
MLARVCSTSCMRCAVFASAAFAPFWRVASDGCTLHHVQFETVRTSSKFVERPSGRPSPVSIGCSSQSSSCLRA